MPCLYRKLYELKDRSTESADTELNDKRMLLLLLARPGIDDDDNSTKCDALLADAQFRRNFPQFRVRRIMEHGAIICCRRLRLVDRGPYALSWRRSGSEVSPASCRDMRALRETTTT